MRQLESGVLGKVFVPKTDKGMREWRRLHKEVLYELYYLSNIIRVIKSRRIKWTGHVARMGDTISLIQVFTGDT
jgi:hypothetical protein